MRKILFIVIDGLADRPIKAFGGKTPLEAAKTVNLDLMAQKGLCGLLKPVFRGSFPNSSDAHLSLFGYSLKTNYVGRGVFETLGVGFCLHKGDVAIRGNFATLDSKGRIIDRRAGRIKNTAPLIKTLQGIKIDGVDCFVIAGIAHRVMVILRGKNLSDKISESDPEKIMVKPKIIKPLKRPGGRKADAVVTAKILNEFSQQAAEILKNHQFNKKREQTGLLPANYILLRAAGQMKPLANFEKKWGTKPCTVSLGLYQGVAKALGMAVLENVALQTSIEEKVKIAIDGLKKYDFCFLHFKDVDESGHDGDCLAKKKNIEKIDKTLAMALSLPNALVVVTADHATPCLVKQHTADSVPALIYQTDVGKDVYGQLKPAEKFSEKACQKAGWGVRLSNSFMKMVMRLAKK